jgi:hypothetical protein
MADETDPATIIEEVLRAAVLPGLVVRIRPMSDGELALDILDALDAQGFAVVRKDDSNPQALQG